MLPQVSTPANVANILQCFTTCELQIPNTKMIVFRDVF